MIQKTICLFLSILFFQGMVSAVQPLITDTTIKVETNEEQYQVTALFPAEKTPRVRVLILKMFGAGVTKANGDVSWRLPDTYHIMLSKGRLHLMLNLQTASKSLKLRTENLTKSIQHELYTRKDLQTSHKHETHKSHTDSTTVVTYSCSNSGSNQFIAGRQSCGGRQ